jgi:hypothetical protein
MQGESRVGATIGRRGFLLGAGAAVVASGARAAAPDYRGAFDFLRFYRRWDTPAQDEAEETVDRLLRQAPDFASFERAAGPQSRERLLVELYLAQFDAAARHIRSGRLDGDLYFDGWIDAGRAWRNVRPWILGLRAEEAKPGLHADFEWLVGAEAAFWELRRRHPIIWPEIDHRPASQPELKLFHDYAEIWSQPRDTEARAWFAQVRFRVRNRDDLLAAAPPGSREWTRFDRLMSAYDQAGMLMKNGYLNPTLFFSTWQSPAAVWAIASPWVKELRRVEANPRLYDNFDGLVEAERSWQAGKPI